MSDLLHFDPPLYLEFECLQGFASTDICTSMSETLASESLVQHDAPSCAVLPGGVCVV